MPQKVTDPKKIVTDELVLKRLAEQGIDKDYVEFWHDYAPRSKGKEYSPYAKFYRDLKSGKHIMATSGLPKVTVMGHPIEVGWLGATKQYYSKANLFSAIVEGKQIQVTCLSDQPRRLNLAKMAEEMSKAGRGEEANLEPIYKDEGAKKNDRVTWEPQLFLNGVEQTCGEATLLQTDPSNQYYHENVLEWDYGFCKRRARIIEGRFRDKIYIDSDPGGEVKVANSVTGNLRLRFGSRDARGNVIGTVLGDMEIISQEELAKAKYPVTIGASPETFYPDDHEEVSSVDGCVGHLAGGVTWTTIIGAAGNNADDDATSMKCTEITLGAPIENTFDAEWRAIFLFDTSGLPDDCKITGATLSLYGHEKGDQIDAYPEINIYGPNPASNVALDGPDYESGVGKFETTPLCDMGVLYADFDVDLEAPAENSFILNSAGRAKISKTGVTKLGAREMTYDVGGAEPPWPMESAFAWVYAYTAEKGTGYKPKLVVTYTPYMPASRPVPMAAAMMATGAI